jgi:predicted protein tyrosine phosphatase
MRALFVMADAPYERNCSEWRARIPAIAMFNAGYEVRSMSWQQFLAQEPREFTTCYSSDVIVYERILTEKAATVLKQWKKQGKIIIFDMDDGYEYIPEYSVSYKTWHIGTETTDNEPLIKSLKRNIGIFDAVTVPTKRLAELWKNYANVVVIPNYPNLRDPMWSRSVNIKIPGIIGWGGSQAHVESFEGSDVIEALRDSRKFMIFSNNQRITNLFPKAIKMGMVSFDDWPMQITNFSVGIAPVSGNYDACRSNIKVIEYAARGVPWVASEGSVYQGCLGGILVPNKQRKWKEAIITLLEDRSVWERYSKEGFEWAEKLDINNNIRQRIELYLSLTNG